MIIGNHFFIDFREVESGNQFGKILAASINVQEQVIILTRDGVPNQIIDEDFVSVCYDDSTGEEIVCSEYKAKGQKIRHTYDDYNPLRQCCENLKTISNSQRERMGRMAIRAFIGKNYSTTKRQALDEW